MSEADRIKSILDAIDLLMAARDAAMNKADRNIIYFMMTWSKWNRVATKCRRAQYHLLNQLELGGWNCFR